MPDSPDRVPRAVVLLAVVFLNIGYAVTHGYTPDHELLAALFVVGGYNTGRAFDVARKRPRPGSSEERDA